MKKLKIRPLAICVFYKEGSILVFEGHDPTKGETFYRPLGGGIQFGEHSRDAVVREIREELVAEVANLRYLGALENIFVYDGQPGHEIVLVWDGEFVDESLYRTAELTGHEEGEGSFRALWKQIRELRDGGAPLYPDGLLELLSERLEEVRV